MDFVRDGQLRKRLLVNYVGPRTLPRRCFGEPGDRKSTAHLSPPARLPRAGSGRGSAAFPPRHAAQLNQTGHGACRRTLGKKTAPKGTGLRRGALPLRPVAAEDRLCTGGPRPLEPATVQPGHAAAVAAATPRTPRSDVLVYARNSRLRDEAVYPCSRIVLFSEPA